MGAGEPVEMHPGWPVNGQGDACLSRERQGGPCPGGLAEQRRPRWPERSAGSLGHAPRSKAGEPCLCAGLWTLSLEMHWVRHPQA